MLKSSNWSEMDYQISDMDLHCDNRGYLFEAMRFETQEMPVNGQLYVYSVEPKARRGDHYHEHKQEWFFCASGEVKLFLKTRSGEIVEDVLTSHAPRMVYVGPGTSHAVENVKSEQVAVIVAYSSKEFDPKNPDTIIEEVKIHG